MRRPATAIALALALVAVAVALAAGGGGDDEEKKATPPPSEAPLDGGGGGGAPPTESGQLPPEFLECMADKGYRIESPAEMHSAPPEVLQECFGALHQGG